MGFWSALGSFAGNASSSIAAGAGSIVGSLADTVLNGYYNRKAASKQNEYSWSMWHAANEYNSPKNQMARYAEAGLNPNLIYGQSNTTSQGSVPSVQPTRSNLSQSLMNYYTIQNMDAQNKRLSMENRKYEKDLETYEETGIWPSDSNPMAQFTANVLGAFFEHFGYKPESLAAGAGAYLGDMFKGWMSNNGGKR